MNKKGTSFFWQPSDCIVGGRTGDYLISEGRDQKEMTHRAVSSRTCGLVACTSGRACFGRCRIDLRGERLLPAVEVRYRCSDQHSGQSFAILLMVRPSMLG